MPRNPKSKKGGWKDIIVDNRKPLRKGDRVRAAVERLRRGVVIVATHANIPTNEQAVKQSDREAAEKYNKIVEENQK